MGLFQRIRARAQRPVEVLPPRNWSSRDYERAHLTDTQRADAMAVDRYFAMLDRPDELRKVGRSSEALETALALVDLLPALVADTIRDVGEFLVQSIPPLDCALVLGAVLERRDVIDRVDATVASSSHLMPWRPAVQSAAEDLLTVGRIREHVVANPGAVQAKLPKAIQVPGTDTRRLILHLESAGRLRRVKAGNSYQLYWVANDGV